MTHAHDASSRFYVMIYVALVILLIVTVGVAYFPMGVLGIAVALLIATIKALLVILFFMHVKESSRLTWLFVVAGFAWLALLLVLTTADFVTRSPVL